MAGNESSWVGGRFGSPPVFTPWLRPWGNAESNSKKSVDWDWLESHHLLVLNSLWARHTNRAIPVIINKAVNYILNGCHNGNTNFVFCLSERNPVIIIAYTFCIWFPFVLCWEDADCGSCQPSLSSTFVSPFLWFLFNPVQCACVRACVSRLRDNTVMLLSSVGIHHRGEEEKAEEKVDT